MSNETDIVESINKQWRAYQKSKETIRLEAESRVEEHLARLRLEKAEQLEKEQQAIQKLNEEEKMRRQLADLDAYGQ